MKKTFGIVALSASIIFFSQLTASALTITYTDFFTDATTELAAEELRVNLWNSALFSPSAVLLNVELTLTASMSSEGTITNNAATSETFTVSTRAEEYAGIGVNLPSPLPDPVAAMTPFTLINTDTYVNLAPGATAAFGPGSTGDVVTTLYNGMHGSFIGSGLYGYDFDTTTLTTISGAGGNISGDIFTTASGKLEVTYTYTDVPEPATMLLFGAGLAGLAGVRRRKNIKENS